MQCQNCSAENPEGAKFCIECANPLQRLCQTCSFENPASAKFCAQCAAPLNVGAPVRRVTEPHYTLTGERRHLTVLFCDLSTQPDSPHSLTLKNGGRSSPGMIVRLRRPSSALMDMSPSTLVMA